ncbi:MAG: helix-turn-helix transcriptional regulator [Deltaproteobacteria bacterium]|nr:helix-turn-helix transcriptional regulator [Deltaproteobacteria bacterium]
MSQIGQPPQFSIVDMQRPVVGYAADFPNGFELTEHRHPAGQLLYASSGVMTVATKQGRWIVPPQRAVWVPPSVTHSVRMSGQVKVRTLYLDTSILRDPSMTCCVVNVNPLLRELILRVVEFVQPYPLDGPEARIAAVVTDEIRVARVAPLYLPMPRDPRLLAITTQLARNPADRRTLAQWSCTAGASLRTLARLFQRETGLSFARWRQQACLLRALELLAAGDSVTSAAIDLGYDSVSAFISMFRSSLGTTPAKYFRRGD